MQSVPQKWQSEAGMYVSMDTLIPSFLFFLSLYSDANSISWLSEVIRHKKFKVISQNLSFAEKMANL